MKNCHKWMILCVVGAIAIVFLLPKLGIPVAGASLLVTLLMVGCCVLPMLFMMKSASGEKGGCCGKMDDSKTSADGKEQSQDSKKPSCH